MAKARFDIKTEAIKPLYAGAGVTEIAVEKVKGYVADAQKRLTGVQADVTAKVADVQKTVTEFEPKSVQAQAKTVVTARVEALSNEAKARRAAIERRIAELQAEAKAVPAKVQARVDENVSAATSTYGDLVKRGETFVLRLRGAEAPKPVQTPATPAAKKAPARKAPAAKKAPAKKAPATKAVASN